MWRSMITNSPSRSVCSTMTTASAPRGTGAPVMISTASPGPTSPGNVSPARTSPITRRTPGTLRERRANPSRTERAVEGWSRSALISSARTHPALSPRGVSTIVAGVPSDDSAAERTSRTTHSRASAKCSVATNSLYRADNSLAVGRTRRTHCSSQQPAEDRRLLDYSAFRSRIHPVNAEVQPAENQDRNHYDEQPAHHPLATRHLFGVIHLHLLVQTVKHGNPPPKRPV